MIRTGFARVRGALSMANQPDMFHMSIILTILPSSNLVIAVSATTAPVLLQFRYDGSLSDL